MKRASGLALRWLLGLFFLAAGLSKVGAPMQTLAAVYSYQIVLPDGLASAIAYTLPWVEIILGLALLSGASLRANILGQASGAGVRAC